MVQMKYVPKQEISNTNLLPNNKRTKSKQQPLSGVQNKSCKCGSLEYVNT